MNRNPHKAICYLFSALAIFAFPVIGNSAAHESAAHENPVPSVNEAQTVAAFHAAISSGDKSRALSFLQEDVIIFESGHKEQSKAEYAAHHLDSDIAFSKSVKRVINNTQTLVAKGMSVVIQESETSGEYKGKAVHMVGLDTIVLKPVNGVWKIAHIHWSSRKAH